MEAKSKKKPIKIEDMSKEQIRQAILKKRECTVKAQNIVESLINSSVTEEYLLKCVPEINQSHFDDVVEERFITHLCGYPICSTRLSEKDIPKQKYRISTKTNKVYDITARKSFCSNLCYKSAMYIKKQMLTSPLWFREYEVIPSFRLLPSDTQGSLGEEVDVSIIDKVKIKEKSFASFKDFANATLQEISPDKNNENNPIQSNESTSLSRQEELNIINCTEGINNTTAEHNVKHNTNPIENTEKEENNNQTKTLENHTIKPRTSSLNIIGAIIEKTEEKLPPIEAPVSIKKKTKEKHKNTIPVLVVEIEKSIAEWFTLDTLIYLFGEEKVKNMVTEKGDDIKDYLNNMENRVAYTSNTYDQYQQLCRKLNILELEDKKFDARNIPRETKPLPDYTILKEESKKLQLKVKAYYSGTTEISETTEPEDEDQVIKQLPLVEKHAQNAIRRRILLQQLNKFWSDILRSLGIESRITSDIAPLINTFNLKANNVMFKPIQWTLITLIIIKLLSFRDEELKHMLEQPKASQHLQLLLLSHKQDSVYLDRLVSWLTDVDRLLCSS